MNNINHNHNNMSIMKQSINLFSILRIFYTCIDNLNEEEE